MSQKPLTSSDRTELIVLGQIITNTARHFAMPGKVISNLANQLPENLRKSDDRHSQH